MVARKEIYIIRVDKGKKEIEVKYSKDRSKSIDRSPLSGVKHILWHQLLVQATKFMEYLILVEDEKDLIKTCNQICR